MQLQLQPSVGVGRNLDVSRIAPRLYQGSFPATGPGVANGRFTHLVLCCMEPDLQPSSRLYPGVNVMHNPMHDGELTDAELRQAWRGAVWTTEAMRRGARCLVTCRMGLNRSGIVVALTLRLLTGAPGAGIVDHIRLNRGDNALRNPEFERYLRGLR